jgi:hypothetical protein
MYYVLRGSDMDREVDPTARDNMTFKYQII